MKVTRSQLEKAIQEELEDFHEQGFKSTLAYTPQEIDDIHAVRDEKVSFAANQAVNLFVDRLPEDIYSHLGEGGAEQLKEMARQALHAVLESEL